MQSGHHLPTSPHNTFQNVAEMNYQQAEHFPSFASQIQSPKTLYGDPKNFSRLHPCWAE